MERFLNREIGKRGKMKLGEELGSADDPVQPRMNADEHGSGGAISE